MYRSNKANHAWESNQLTPKGTTKQIHPARHTNICKKSDKIIQRMMMRTTAMRIRAKHPFPTRNLSLGMTSVISALWSIEIAFKPYKSLPLHTQWQMNWQKVLKRAMIVTKWQSRLGLHNPSNMSQFSLGFSKYKQRFKSADPKNTENHVYALVGKLSVSLLMWYWMLPLIICYERKDQLWQCTLADMSVSTSSESQLLCRGAYTIYNHLKWFFDN